MYNDPKAVTITLAGMAAAIFLFIKRKKDNHRKRKRQDSSDDEVGGDGKRTVRARTSNTDLPEGETYEVFLSFRGEDTRKDFTDHLYKGLVNVGVRVFRDNEALRVGEEIGPELDQAIKASKISIPIISPNYASSKWCLRELVHILECKKTAGQVVLPVFYRVDPSSVRHQIGTFETAFHSHNKKYGSNREDVQKWRSALREVASLKGWESSKISDGHEGELVEIVVTKVLNELKKATLDVTDRLVGIEDRKTEILKMVEGKESRDAQAIVIHGMGGIGKTTLAKVIYNQLSTKFKYCTFLPNIREKLTEQKCRPEDLQKQLISDILGQQWSDQIQHIDQGINIIKDRLKQKKVLILFDDVDRPDQLNALARERGWFKSGSILIITTRNKDVLNTWEEGRLTYELNELDPSLSFLLFCWHAFRRDECPSMEFHTIAKDIVSTTRGLPLAIEVIGSMLLGKSKVYWEGVYKRLLKIPNEDVQKKLKISYDALNKEQKQIFLDIACLSIQKEINYAIYMWDDCDFFPQEGIEKLISLSLIKIDEEKQLSIHEQLRDLGRAIVREEDSEPGRRSRLWDEEEALKVIQRNQGTAEIKALDLCLDYESSKEDRDFTSERFKKFTSEQFTNLTNLRFLHLRYANLVGDFKNVLLDLRWLQLEGSRWRFVSLPTNFCPINLVVLEFVDIRITEKWEGWAQVELVKNLKVLKLDGCFHLTSTPDFSAFEKLEILILDGCGFLRRIHSSIHNLNKTLVTLHVRCCPCLEELPNEMGEMEELRHLLVDWTSIRTIPISKGYMTKLEILSATGCEHLQHLPESIGNLKSLTTLNLGGSKVMELPNSIGDLHNLKVLDISRTPIKTLPTTIGQLRNLQHFTAFGLLELTEIPHEIGGLCSLQKLELTECKDLNSMPESIGNLKPLTTLNLRGSKVMELPSSIGDLHNLQVLDISWTSIKTLPTTIGQLRNLQHFTACHVSELTQVPEEIGELPSLQTLDLSECKNLKSMPNLPCSLTSLNFTSESMETLPNLTNLSNLKDLYYCNEFQRWNRVLDFGSLNNLMSLRIDNGFFPNSSIENIELVLELPSSLKELYLSGCPTLRALPSLSRCKMLSSLEITSCDNLSELGEIGDAVTYCTLSRCNALERLPNLSNAKHLKSLIVKCCENLMEIQGFDGTECLQVLKIHYCSSLERLGDLSCLKMLTELELINYKKQSDFDGIDELSSLQKLKIIRCNPKTKSLDLSRLKNLRILILEQFEILLEIKMPQKLEYLEKLEISCCDSLDELPDFSLSTSLVRLIVKGFEKLPEIKGLPVSLRALDISGWKSLVNLPNIPQCCYLEGLLAEGCNKLTKIKGLEGQKELKILNFSSCKSLEGLPDFSLLEKLVHLSLNGCEKLTEIKGLPISLKSLNLSGCNSLVNLPELSRCCSIEVLLAGGCSKITSITRLSELCYLEMLDLSDCKSLEDLPDFSLFEKLQKLCLNGCENLTEIKGLPVTLRTLDISGCNSLVNLPDLSRCCSLEGLLAGSCSKLTSIMGLSELCYLETLNLSDCKSLEDLPDFSLFEKLEQLWLNGCEKLTEIKGLPVTLTTLDISGCKLLVNLPNFSKFHSLVRLFAEDCSKLVEFQGLEQLQKFHVLAIHGCESLKRKPNLPNDCIYSDPLHYTRENITLNGKMTLKIQSELDRKGEKWMCHVCLVHGWRYTDRRICTYM